MIWLKLLKLFGLETSYNLTQLYTVELLQQGPCKKAQHHLLFIVLYYFGYTV